MHNIGTFSAIGFLAGSVLLLSGAMMFIGELRKPPGERNRKILFVGLFLFADALFLLFGFAHQNHMI